MPHPIYIVFAFLLGACVGSFLNVVVWRLPRIIVPPDTSPWKVPWVLVMGLSDPPSHCPACERRLHWYDNIPILGWLKLGGRCRFCQAPISKRYPIVELITALMFVVYYVMFYVAEVPTCPPLPWSVFADAGPLHVPLDWPVFALYLFLVSALLAASLIDAELFLIPASIPWCVVAVGLILHTCFDQPTRAGALNLVTRDAETRLITASPAAALAAGGGVGLLVSLALWYLGKLPLSFPQGEPLLEVDREALAEENRKAKRDGREPEPVPPEYTKAQIRAEIRKEMAFLLPPMMLAVVWYLMTLRLPGLRSAWESAVVDHHWFSGLLGSVFGGLVGGFVVWITRILGTLGFGRVAMGLGDVDLMFAVGCVLGAGPAAVAFFVAPFFGILLAVYMLLTGTKRELPYGPYLSLATGFVMLFYCPIADWLAPGLEGLRFMVHNLLGR